MKNLLHLSKQLSMLMLLCLMPVFAWAQSRITGTVNDEFGDPIVGATVQVKGTSIGAITDIDGNFSIEAPANSILTVRFVGYKAQEVQASNKPVVVALQEDSDILDEVVVVGYGQMKRSDLTGSVVSVNDAAIKKSVSTSVDQALQGRAAGVQIQANTGTPGGSSTIKIRGTNSLNATSQPIFVIDGVIVDAANGDDDGNSNPLASINPSDIVSMDVLKDASATAIYGARASNGVIMITTRRGQSGDAIITYDGYVGWQQMPKKLDVMNLQEFAQHWQDIANAGIRSRSDQYVRPELLGEGTDWQSELFRTAVMHSHNLSVTGGNDKSTYGSSSI